MEEQININDILSLFARRWWVILLCGLIVGAVTFSFTYFLVAPVYTSSGTLYVNNVKDKNAINLTQNDIMLSQKLVNTYAEILNSEILPPKYLQEAGFGGYLLPIEKDDKDVRRRRNRDIEGQCELYRSRDGT